MKLGELRALLKDVPDDADILIDEGDLQFAEVNLKYVLNPVLGHAHAVLLDMGQVWNYELDLDNRIDGYHVSQGFDQI